MAVIRKKSKQSSLQDLLVALDKLIYLLEGQNEKDAIADLAIAKEDLKKYDSATEEHKSALLLIQEAFESEHELIAYTYKRTDKKDEGQWSDIEELYMASSAVHNLVKRLIQTKKE